MGAATAMPVAKMLNVWDRGYGFLVMILLSLIGLILSAATTNIYTYCAAQVFWSVGYTGAIFTVDIITTDTSSLRDRGLAYAFTSSPYLITAFAGPKAAEVSARRSTMNDASQPFSSSYLTPNLSYSQRASMQRTGGGATAALPSFCPS